MSSKLTTIIDADYIKYSVAYACQKTSIVVTHPTLGVHDTFKTRTDFYGHHAKKAGGWLAEYNTGRDSPILPSEFTIEDVVVPERIDFTLSSARSMFNDAAKKQGAKLFKGFLGKGDSFRVARSTLTKYKNRTSPKPFHLEAVGDYLERKMGCEIVTGIEADDRCVIEAFGKKDHFIQGEDKDYYGCNINFFNVNKPEDGIVDCSGLGSLWLQEKVDSKGKPFTEVKGKGRMWLYQQVASGDDVDTYWANSASNVKWGEKSAYSVLKDCKSDKEAFEALVRIFKILYPEPKSHTTWQGATITIDWLYCLQECFTMARMLRTEDEKEIQVVDILNKIGVNY